jgi:hypothetical protein
MAGALELYRNLTHVFASHSSRAFSKAALLFESMLS